MRELPSVIRNRTIRPAITGAAVVLLAVIVRLWFIGAVTLPAVGIGGVVAGGILGAVTAGGRQPHDGDARGRTGPTRRSYAYAAVRRR